MKKLLRRIRGVIGMGLTWAMSWSVVGVVMAALPGVLPRGFPFVSGAIGFALQFATLGFIGGAAFAVVLAASERRRRLDEMSLPRFAVWGAVGGVLMWVMRTMVGGSLTGVLAGLGVPPVVWVYALPGAAIVGLGAGCAAASFALARRAEDLALLEAGERVSTVGLTAEELRELV